MILIGEWRIGERKLAWRATHGTAKINLYLVVPAVSLKN
jgi:hypothetical protein